MEEDEVPPEALAAVQAGVTPEDIAQAEALLAAGEGGAEAMAPAPPEGEDAEKTQMMGDPTMGAAAGMPAQSSAMGATPSPMGGMGQTAAPAPTI